MKLGPSIISNMTGIRMLCDNQHQKGGGILSACPGPFTLMKTYQEMEMVLLSMLQELLPKDQTGSKWFKPDQTGPNLFQQV